MRKLKENLTRAERGVLNELLKDKGQKDMAFELGISIKTFSTHTQAIYRKLGVKSRVGLFLLLLRTLPEVTHIIDNE